MKTEYVYKVSKDGKICPWFTAKTEQDCWGFLYHKEAFGLDKEYTYSKAQLKYQGFKVHKFKLVEVK
jgi:hypothetical protein